MRDLREVNFGQKSCVWRPYTYGKKVYECFYNTQCRMIDVLADKWFKFCPYCGKPIKILGKDPK